MKHLYLDGPPRDTDPGYLVLKNHKVTAIQWPCRILWKRPVHHYEDGGRTLTLKERMIDNERLRRLDPDHPLLECDLHGGVPFGVPMISVLVEIDDGVVSLNGNRFRQSVSDDSFESQYLAVNHPRNAHRWSYCPNGTLLNWVVYATAQELGIGQSVVFNHAHPRIIPFRRSA